METRMRILHFSTYDLFGGAAKASYRLHTALRNAGHSSRMIVREKSSNDEDVLQVATRPVLVNVRRIQRRVSQLRGTLPKYMFNHDREPEIDTRFFFTEGKGSVDIVCLHWITGLLTTRLIHRLHEHYQCPLVWVMMDQEPVTGGCHYSLGCDRFMNQCGRCPQLNSSRVNDRSRIVWNRKSRYIRDLPLTFAVPTSWAAAKVRESSLFREHRVEVVPLAIDIKTFRPFDQSAARDLLHLPQSKQIIFFGATYLEEPRKGMSFLVEALKHMASRLDHQTADIFLVVAGANGSRILAELPFDGKALGDLKDDSNLALAYQAADIFVCPSIEDAGPMMIPEAMLCGTPVVAFNTGGAPDLIETNRSGYLAAYKDSADLGKGIYEVLTAENLPAMRADAHERAVKAHSATAVADRHLNLYNSLLRTQEPLGTAVQ
jgi:glycosyltransferase involved in cell wall biosynthesis